MAKTTDNLPLIVAASQLANAAFQGYLEKKRPSKKLLSVKYQKRWCLVYGKYFLYYDSPEDKAQKGSFSLEGYRFLPCPGSARYGFSLVSNHKRPFEFIAPDYDNYVSWEQTVKKGISLTRRNAEPVKIVTDTTHDTYGHTHFSQPKYPEKCLTLPNRQLKCSIEGGKSKMAETIAKSCSDSNTDSDEDDNGYIRTARLNCHKGAHVMTRHVDTNSNISKEASVFKNYTEDDYMMVLGDPETNDVCVNDDNDEHITYSAIGQSENKKDKLEKIYSSVKKPGVIQYTCTNESASCLQRSNSDDREADYTEDDYMMVLGDPETNDVCVNDDNDEHITYSVIGQSENKKDKLEKIYSSVKKPGVLQYRCTNESASCLQRSNSDDSEADYANPFSIIDYSQVIKPGECRSLQRLSSCDYEKIDAILPIRICRDSSSSTSSSYDSDDSNDDTQIHNYENPNDLYYSHKNRHINSHKNDQSNSHIDQAENSESQTVPQYNSDTCDSSSDEATFEIPPPLHTMPKTLPVMKTCYNKEPIYENV